MAACVISVTRSVEMQHLLKMAAFSECSLLHELAVTRRIQASQDSAVLNTLLVQFAAAQGQRF